MEELTSMMNIGKEMARKLELAGIGSGEVLRAIGPEEAYLRLKLLWPKVCLVHLYALEGAVTGQAYNALPDGRKRELKAFSDKWKG